jgi:hypothetical protein
MPQQLLQQCLRGPASAGAARARHQRHAICRGHVLVSVCDTLHMSCLSHLPFIIAAELLALYS